MALHDCVQLEAIGGLKKAAEILEKAVSHLHARINGTFDAIDKHIEEGKSYRNEITKLGVIVENIVQEKNNTTKASQWRVGLIVGLCCSIPTAVLVAIAIIQLVQK